MNLKRVIGMFCMLLIVFMPLASVDVYAYLPQQQIQGQQYYPNQGNYFQSQGPYYAGNSFQNTMQSYAPQPFAGAMGYNSQQQFSSTSGQGVWYNQQSLGDKLRQWTSGMGMAGIWGDPINLGEAIIVNIADYEPKIVRSAMLEQQDMPVFVYLRGTTFGTLSSLATGDVSQKDIITGLNGIPPIQYVDIEWDKENPYVAGIQVIPPRDGTYSLDNLGTAMVYLKKLDNEDSIKEIAEGENYTKKYEGFWDRLSDESNVIDINMSAKIYFDFSQQGLLNIGPESLLLKSEPNEDAFMSKPDRTMNSFFSGRGFIRATTINPATNNFGGGSASFIIYDKEMRPLSNILPGPYTTQYNPIRFVRLTEGEVYPNVRFGYSGNPLEDFVSIRLDSVVGPEDRAVVELTVGSVEQKRVITQNKPLYPNSQWYVTLIREETITDGTEAAKARQQLEQQLDFSSVPNANIVKHLMKLSNGYEDKLVTRYTLGGNIEGLKIKKIDQNEAESLEEIYCKATLTSPESFELHSGLAFSKDT